MSLIKELKFAWKVSKLEKQVDALVEDLYALSENESAFKAALYYISGYNEKEITNIVSEWTSLKALILINPEEVISSLRIQYFLSHKGIEIFEKLKSNPALKEVEIPERKAPNILYYRIKMGEFEPDGFV